MKQDDYAQFDDIDLASRRSMDIDARKSAGEKQPPKGKNERRDGYQDTQGSDYDQDRQPQNEQDYDPAESGVRHAQNHPGTRPNTPGRETGTSWGEDQQMGASTDTPDRKNPAG